MLYYAFSAAKHSITIETPYLIPPRALVDALLGARERGVHVRIITPARKANNHPIVSDVGDNAKQKLVAAGVKIYESPYMLHGKTAVIDGHVVLIGSANLNGRSQFWDGEVLSTVWDRTSAGAIEQQLRCLRTADPSRHVQRLRGQVASTPPISVADETRFIPVSKVTKFNIENVVPAAAGIAAFIFHLHRDRVTLVGLCHRHVHVEFFLSAVEQTIFGHERPQRRTVDRVGRAHNRARLVVGGEAQMLLLHGQSADFRRRVVERVPRAVA